MVIVSRDRKHYSLTKKIQDVKTGYRYPGCNQAELRELDHAHENAHRFRGTFRPISQAKATARLKVWLKQPPSPYLQSAIDRLRTAWNDKNWTPNFAIKCFYDLDRVYFKSSLARILLNAKLIFLAPIEHTRKGETFGTFLHEMIHGMS